MTKEQTALLRRAAKTFAEVAAVEAQLAAAGPDILRRLRESRGGSMAEASRAVGLSRSYLWRIGDGSLPMTLGVAARVCGAVGVAKGGEP